MKMYRAWSSMGEIKTHDVEKRTGKSVWAVGYRYGNNRFVFQERIESDDVKWCDTWDEAKAFLVSKARSGVTRAANTLTYREEILRRVESLANPEATEG